MNLSQKQVYDMVTKQEVFTQNDVGFLLTVLRDNCTDEKTHDFMDMLVKETYEKFRQK